MLERVNDESLRAVINKMLDAGMKVFDAEYHADIEYGWVTAWYKDYKISVVIEEHYSVVSVAYKGQELFEENDSRFTPLYLFDKAFKRICFLENTCLKYRGEDKDMTTFYKIVLIGQLDHDKGTKIIESYSRSIFEERLKILASNKEEVEAGLPIAYVDSNLEPLVYDQNTWEYYIDSWKQKVEVPLRIKKRGE